MWTGRGALGSRFPATMADEGGVTTPLHEAAEAGDAARVRALLAAAEEAGDGDSDGEGADLDALVTALDEHDETPADLAAAGGHREALEALLEAREDWLEEDEVRGVRACARENACKPAC